MTPNVSALVGEVFPAGTAINRNGTVIDDPQFGLLRLGGVH